MDINQIEITGEGDNGINIILYAKANSIEMCLCEKVNVITSFPIVKDACLAVLMLKLTRSIKCVLATYRPTELHTVYTSTKYDSEVFSKCYTTDDLFKSLNADCDFNDKYTGEKKCRADNANVNTLYSHYLNEIIKPALAELASTALTISPTYYEDM